MTAIVPTLRRYGLALLAAGIAFAFAFLFRPIGQPFPFAVFLGAVILTAWQGGFGPGLLTTALSGGGLLLLDRLQTGGTGPLWTQEFLVRLGMFTIVGILTAYLSQQCRQAVRAYDQLYDLLASIAEPLILLDARGQVTYLNPQAETLTGWKDAEARSKPLDQVFPLVEESTRQQAAQPVSEVLQDGTSRDLPRNAVLLTARGAVVSVEGKVAAVRDVDDKVVGATLLCRDAEAKRQEEAELRQREEQFQQLAETASIALLLLDRDARCIFANRACQTLCGVTAAETSGEGWTRYIAKTDRDRVISGWLAALRDGKEYTGEFRLQPPKGEIRSVQIRLTPMNNDRGKVLGHVGVLEDLTARKQAEQGIGENRTLLHALLEGENDAIVIKNAEGRNLMANSAAARMLGRVEEPAPTTDGAQADPRRWSLELERQVLATGQPQTVQRVETVDGVRRVYVNTKVPYRDEEGNVRGLIDLTRDVTDLRQAEETLQATRADLLKQVQEATARGSQAETALQQARTDFEKKLKEVKTGKGQSEDTLRKANAELERLAGERSQALKSAEETLGRLRVELARQTEAHVGVRAAAEDTLGLARREWLKQLAVLKGAHGAALLEIQSKLEACSVKIAGQLDALEALEEQLADRQQRCIELEGLRQRLGEAEGQRSEHGSLLDTLRTQLAEAVGQRNESAAMVASLRHQIAGLEEDLGENEALVVALRQQLATVEGQRNEHAATIAALRQQLTELDGQRGQHSSSLTTLEEQLGDLRREKAEQEMRRLKLEDQLEESRKSERELRENQEVLQGMLDEEEALVRKIKAEEERLRQERDLLDAVVQSSPQGIFAFDREYRYTIWNSAMEQLTGCSRSDAVGRSAFELFPSLRASGEDRHYRQAVEGESVLARAESPTRKGGSLENWFAPLRHGGPGILGGIALVREVTEPTWPAPVKGNGKAVHVEPIREEVVEQARPSPRSTRPAVVVKGDWLEFN